MRPLSTDFNLSIKNIWSIGSLLTRAVVAADNCLSTVGRPRSRQSRLSRQKGYYRPPRSNLTGLDDYRVISLTFTLLQLSYWQHSRLCLYLDQR